MMEVNGMVDAENKKQHRVSLPSDYSDVQSKSYDPQYISDISNKMQIPERISVGDSNDLPHFSKHQTRLSNMHVPDRIIVAGDEQHIGLKEGLWNLDLNPVSSSEALQYVGLMTPPRTLTLEERFPVVEDEEIKYNQKVMQKNDLNNSHLYSSIPVPFTPGYSPNDSILLNEEDEAVVLRTHVAKLTRRMAVLEKDNQRRATRELFLYPVVMGYFALRLIFWILKTK